MFETNHFCLIDRILYLIEVLNSGMLKLGIFSKFDYMYSARGTCIDLHVVGPEICYENDRYTFGQTRSRFFQSHHCIQ